MTQVRFGARFWRVAVSFEMFQPWRLVQDGLRYTGGGGGLNIWRFLQGFRPQLTLKGSIWVTWGVWYASGASLPLNNDDQRKADAILGLEVGFIHLGVEGVRFLQLPRSHYPQGFHGICSHFTT